MDIIYLIETLSKVEGAYNWGLLLIRYSCFSLIAYYYILVCPKQPRLVIKLKGKITYLSKMSKSLSVEEGKMIDALFWHLLIPFHKINFLHISLSLTHTHTHTWERKRNASKCETSISISKCHSENIFTTNTPKKTLNICGGLLCILTCFWVLPAPESWLKYCLGPFNLFVNF